VRGHKLEKKKNKFISVGVAFGNQNGFVFIVRLDFRNELLQFITTIRDERCGRSGVELPAILAVASGFGRATATTTASTTTATTTTAATNTSVTTATGEDANTW
jgi:hypothetical protein